LQLQDITVRPITVSEVSRYSDLMQAHHYLGDARPIGETLRYVALWQGYWIALISFSSAALKCAVRDRWIGWSPRHQFDRLNLVTNNSRFLILPEWHIPNLASRVLSLCQRRIGLDWQTHFGHPLLLLETFVDPTRFRGTLYRATNWRLLGLTKGYRRIGEHYEAHASPKQVLVYPLQRNALRILSHPFIHPRYQTGAKKLMLSAAQMQALPDYFKSIPDPRRKQGQRHRLSTILGIAVGAVLCGCSGYKEIWQWAESLSQDARARFLCRRSKEGKFLVPSLSAIRGVLIRVCPEALDKSLGEWTSLYAIEDESLAIDGKTMRSAVDGDGKQTHIMSAIGHQSHTCHAQKKSVRSS
jgi:hypothetical protein